jgi:hypothetical protein
MYRSLNTLLVQLKKLPIGVNTTVELKSIITSSDNTGTLLSQNIARYMPLLLVVVITFLSSIFVSTLHGKFLDCANTAFSECYVLFVLVKTIKVLKY